MSTEIQSDSDDTWTTKSSSFEGEYDEWYEEESSNKVSHKDSVSKSKTTEAVLEGKTYIVHKDPQISGSTAQLPQIVEDNRGNSTFKDISERKHLKSNLTCYDDDDDDDDESFDEKNDKKRELEFSENTDLDANTISQVYTISKMESTRVTKKSRDDGERMEKAKKIRNITRVLGLEVSKQTGSGDKNTGENAKKRKETSEKGGGENTWRSTVKSKTAEAKDNQESAHGSNVCTANNAFIGSSNTTKVAKSRLDEKDTGLMTLLKVDGGRRAAGAGVGEAEAAEGGSRKRKRQKNSAGSVASVQLVGDAGDAGDAAPPLADMDAKHQHDAHEMIDALGDVFQWISQALAVMQKTMKEVKAQMNTTDETVRGVSLRLKSQKQVILKLEKRLLTMEGRVSKRAVSKQGNGTVSSPGTGASGPRTPKKKPLSLAALNARITSTSSHIAVNENSQVSMGINLLKAAQQGRAEAVRNLLEAGADIHFHYGLNWTALHMAAKAHPGVLGVLLKRGANVNARTTNGFTALHIAAYFDFDGRCVSMLIDGGSDLDSRNQCGWTPLHYAAACGNEAAVRELLVAGASKTVRDNEQRTPVDVAAHNVRPLLAVSPTQGRRPRPYTKGRRTRAGWRG